MANCVTHVRHDPWVIFLRLSGRHQGAKVRVDCDSFARWDCRPALINLANLRLVYVLQILDWIRVSVVS
jgi:hypothetical protein